MRILLTADPMIPVPPTLYGGIERIVDGLLAALRARGHEVALLAHPDSTASADARFAWSISEPAGPHEHLRNLADLDRAVRHFRPELVHSFSRLAYLGRWLPHRLPKLMCYQRQPTPRTVHWAARLAGRSLRFAGCSRYIADCGGAIGGRWSAIPNFVDCARLPFVDAVADDAPLAFLSRLERIKGVHTAIEIARRSGRRLVIAGNRVEQGDGAGYFAREIEPHLDGEQVRWIGPVDDVAKAALLGGAAAMLLPIGWDEPFGIVMAEALACGTPVVAFRRGAAPEVVRDGVDGFVVDDVEGAVAAVQRLPSVSRADCRAGALARFDRDVVARQYLAAYAELGVA
jgi:glycosyltransferase involved in cell wall biosynthesis